MKFKIDIENRILIPFMLVIVISILALTLASIFSSYDLIMAKEVEDAQSDLNRVNVLMNELDQVENDQNKKKELILSYINKSKIENFFIYEHNDLIVNHSTIDLTNKSLDDYILVDDTNKEYDWNYGYALNNRAIFYDVLDENKSLILITIIAITISMEIAILISYSISKPIKKLAQYCDKIIDAKDISEVVTIKRNDEIGTLSNALNNMVFRLDENNKKMIEMEFLSTIGQFAAGIAHEIRNPLTGIRTSMQVLKGRLLVEENTMNERLFEGVNREIHRINSLISDLLLFSKPKNPVKNLINLKDLAKKTIINKEFMLNNKDIKINIKGDENVLVEADENQFYQIIINLLTNSINSIEVSGTIDLLIEKSDYTRLIIEDNGCGISIENQKNIFKPFFTTHSDGTGLGMCIVYELVKLNGGSIFVDSTEGMGTKVVIQLLNYKEG